MSLPLSPTIIIDMSEGNTWPYDPCFLLLYWYPCWPDLSPSSCFSHWYTGIVVPREDSVILRCLMCDLVFFADFSYLNVLRLMSMWCVDFALIMFGRYGILLIFFTLYTRYSLSPRHSALPHFHKFLPSIFGESTRMSLWCLWCYICLNACLINLSISTRKMCPTHFRRLTRIFEYVVKGWSYMSSLTLVCECWRWCAFCVHTI